MVYDSNSIGGEALNSLRHEEKYYISYAGYLQLKARLSAALEMDKHTTHPDGKYAIRSVYFDDYCQSGLLDKVEGVENREKFRVRCYDYSDAIIRLEAKQKLGQMTRKLSATLTREQADKLLAGDLWALYDDPQPLVRNFYLKARTRLLKPAVVVDYYREAFVYHDVRLTFDSNICSGRFGISLFDSSLPTVAVMPSDRLVLEVKYDEALPFAVKQLLKTVPLTRCAISKYALCREWQ